MARSDLAAKERRERKRTRQRRAGANLCAPCTALRPDHSFSRGFLLPRKNARNAKEQTRNLCDLCVLLRLARSVSGARRCGLLRPQILRPPPYAFVVGGWERCGRARNDFAAKEHKDRKEGRINLCAPRVLSRKPSTRRSERIGVVGHTNRPTRVTSEFAAKERRDHKAREVLLCVPCVLLRLITLPTSPQVVLVTYPAPIPDGPFELGAKKREDRKDASHQPMAMIDVDVIAGLPDDVAQFVNGFHMPPFPGNEVFHVDSEW